MNAAAWTAWLDKQKAEQAVREEQVRLLGSKQKELDAGLKALAHDRCALTVCNSLLLYDTASVQNHIVKILKVCYVCLPQSDGSLRFNTQVSMLPRAQLDAEKDN